MRWNDLTLRTQVMAIVLVSWTIVGAFSIVSDVIQVRNARAEEIKNRGDAFLAQVVSTIAQTPAEDRQQVASSFFPAEWRVTISDENAAASLVHGLHRPNLADWFKERLETRGLNIAALSVADTVVHRWDHDNALLALFENRSGEPSALIDGDENSRYLISFFSVQLTGETEWLNCYLLLRKKRIWPALLIGSIDSLIALIMLCLLAILIQRIMRPLTAMAVNAELIGRGEEVGPLVEVGSADIRQTIVAFNQMEARIVLALEYKTSLLRSLGHDLKGPIARLDEAIQDISPDTLRGQLKRRLEKIQQMVDSVTDLNRQTHHDGEVVRVDLASLVEALVEEQVEAGRDVTCVIEHGLTINGRHNALTRMLRNLLENAVKYGGRTKITLTKSEDLVAILVDDEGPGIPAEQLETAFEPFQRLGASEPGSGLGLAIVKTIVMDQGGTVKLENRSGGGLRASVYLPIEREA